MNLTQSDRLVYEYIVRETSNGNNILEKTVKDMGMENGISDATISRAINKLESLGKIYVEPSNKRTESNAYFLITESDAELLVLLEYSLKSSSRLINVLNNRLKVNESERLGLIDKLYSLMEELEQREQSLKDTIDQRNQLSDQILSLIAPGKENDEIIIAIEEFDATRNVILTCKKDK